MGHAVSCFPYESLFWEGGFQLQLCGRSLQSDRPSGIPAGFTAFGGWLDIAQTVGQNACRSWKSKSCHPEGKAWAVITGLRSMDGFLLGALMEVSTPTHFSFPVSFRTVPLMKLPWAVLSGNQKCGRFWGRCWDASSCWIMWVQPSHPGSAPCADFCWWYPWLWTASLGNDSGNLHGLFS